MCPAWTGSPRWRATMPDPAAPVTAVALLAELEWSNYQSEYDEYSCPECLSERDDGHDPDCRLALLIDAPRRKPNPRLNQPDEVLEEVLNREAAGAR